MLPLLLLRHMSPVSLVLTLVGLVAIWYLVGAIVNYRKLRFFPGPPLAGYSRFWMFWQSIHANVHVAQAEALKKYGCPARIGPDLLVVDDPDMIRHFNSQSSGWRRSRWYDSMRFDPRLDTVFSTRDEKLHADLRSREATAYNGRDVATLETDVDARVRDLINLIHFKYSNTTVDMASVTRFFTLDVLSTVAFGRPFGFMAANEDLWGYNQANSEFFGILELCSNHKFFYWILNTSIMRWLFAPKATDSSGMGPALAFSQKAVAERFGPDPKIKHDMLGHFVEKGLSQVRCETEAFLQIIAGSDSTTTVLRCTMYLLVSNPGAYARLRKEVDEAYGGADGSVSPASYSSSATPSPRGHSPNGSISTRVTRSSGSVHLNGNLNSHNLNNFNNNNNINNTATPTKSDIISYTTAQNLPYLSAVIWEGIRMYPPLFGLKSKVAPAGGDTINGIYYPGGTEVCICDASMCRRTEIFGEDANIFRPERWLEADELTRKRMLRTTEAVFGTGRFQCLGKHIAMMELHKTYVELIRNFDWQLADPMRGISQVSHGVHNQSGMNMVARRRHHYQPNHGRSNYNG